MQTYGWLQVSVNNVSRMKIHNSINDLDRIEFLLKGAEGHADLCDPVKASQLYRKADDLLRRIEGEC